MKSVHPRVRILALGGCLSGSKNHGCFEDMIACTRSEVVAPLVVGEIPKLTSGVSPKGMAMQTYETMSLNGTRDDLPH
jgi:hypothetical protein